MNEHQQRALDQLAAMLRIAEHPTMGIPAIQSIKTGWVSVNLADNKVAILPTYEITFTVVR